MRTRTRVGWHRYFNGLYLATTLTIIFVLVPIYLMVATSFKTQAGVQAVPTQWFPSPISTTNYHQAFVQYTFGRYILNSVIVAVVTTALVLALGTLAGYALGRLPMRGKLPILLGLLMISVFPAIAVIAPLYTIMRDLGWLNSYQALILPYTAFNLPFAIWILRNYFLGIPKEMEETGRIDGASPLRTVWSIVLPQALPGLFTAAIFTFTACWTEFLMALTFNSSNSFRTIPVGVALFGSQFTTPYGNIFAASTVAVIPIAILVFIFRKSVVAGLTSGAVKGLSELGAPSATEALRVLGGRPGVEPAPWWQGAVLYQVYVRSFCDTDGDGYGDLRGVLGRLGHLAWLGVDAIWLSPTMPSPDTDWGYDVADYLGVHPQLGTLADLDELVAEASLLGIKVLLDLVPNHTSDAHPWFVDACSSKEAAHRGYYVWADGRPDGGPPNNWLDNTGEGAWAYHAPTGQYYLHNFLASQPDLNWWEPAVHQEFEEVLRFWWDRGVAGFRIDVAHGLYKDAGLRDNPPAPAPEVGVGPLPDGARSAEPGRWGLLQAYNANRPETHDVYRAWRKLAEGYRPARTLLGETFVLDVADLTRFYGQDDELQLAFNFPFVFAPFTATGMASVVGRTLDLLPEGACPTWAASNHDVGRFPTRWAGADGVKARLALTVLLTLPGAAVLYYGDEIGMVEVEVPDELQRDPMTWHGRGGRPNRDRSRTPMQWSAQPGAGFTAAGSQPWLPLGDHVGVNVEAQRDDPASTLSLCRSLVQLRHQELGHGIAPYQLQEPGPQRWAYRVAGLDVVANFSDDEAEGQAGEWILSSVTGRLAGGAGAGSGKGVLSPWEAVVGRHR